MTNEIIYSFKDIAHQRLTSCREAMNSKFWNLVIQNAYFSMIYSLLFFLIANGKQYGKKIIHETVISFFIQKYCYMNKKFIHIRTYIQELQNLKTLVDKKINLNEQNAYRAYSDALFINETIQKDIYDPQN